jgi:hypothetical protein
MAWHAVCSDGEESARGAAAYLGKGRAMSRRRTRTQRPALLTQLLVMTALAAGFSRLAVAVAGDDPPIQVARASDPRGSISPQADSEPKGVAAILLTAGDQPWTQPGARTELNMGLATIRLDASKDFSSLEVDDRMAQTRLTQRAITVSVQRLRSSQIVKVEMPNRAFSVLQQGSYRVEASSDGSSTLVAVRAGEGEMPGSTETYMVHFGRSTRFTSSDVLGVTVLHAGRIDELDQWGQYRGQYRDRGSDEPPSARYVSYDATGYEDLDDNGIWRMVPSYGDVWIPYGYGVNGDWR